MSDVLREKRAKFADEHLPLDLSNKPRPSTSLTPIFSIKKIIIIDTKNIIKEKEKNNTVNTSIITVSNNFSDIPNNLLNIELNLSINLDKLNYNNPIDYIYCPIIYAKTVHFNYLNKYCRDKKNIMILGMNPGPWGMSQTGVPFGEINIVIDWLKINGHIDKPKRQHEQRQVDGFSCKRSEISGRKFWSLFKKLSNNPDTFFRHCFLRNFFKPTIIIIIIAGPEQKKLQEFCDQALIEVIKILDVKVIIGVGRFSEQRAKKVVKTAKLSTKVLWMIHPSPRATIGKNWQNLTLDFLKKENLIEYFIDDNSTTDFEVF
ncbi:hypothetical protein HCN44_010761 [Aphidius gifuensis]|uniref:Uracil-DNA glycosylase-like domain-containing protein n=1 Tax=Aphidius gifuensis TaxID=684658 RepID=A0A834XTY0_APHGI|nr:hypothetical protein HCN44_010761 [Aphidius gifuensis]